MSVWTVEEVQEVKVYLNGNFVTSKSEVTADDVVQIAREHGLKKFIVKNEAGETLTQEDFPVSSGKLYIEEYSTAA